MDKPWNSDLAKILARWAKVTRGPWRLFIFGWDNGRAYFPGLTPDDVRTAVGAHVKALGLPCPLPPFPDSPAPDTARSTS